MKPDLSTREIPYGGRGVWEDDRVILGGGQRGLEGQGSGNSIFNYWGSRLPLRMEVAFGHLKKLPP